MARNDRRPETDTSERQHIPHSSDFIPSPDYRTGVGIVLLNPNGDVFLGRRARLAAEAWQMPQGGINPGEPPREAVFRELREEIGTDAAEVIAESSGWYKYDVPAALVPPSWQRSWRGQCQKWFALRFSGVDDDIDVATAHPEFDAWKWCPANRAADLVVSFKRDVYRAVFSEFEAVLQNQRKEFTSRRRHGGDSNAHG